MSAVSDAGQYRDPAARWRWLPVLAGLLVLFVPTFYDLAAWLWQQDEHAHGPIILAIIGWLIWQRRAALFDAPAPAPSAGIACLTFGLLLYVVGRSQEIMLFELGALAPVLAGTVLALCGWRALRMFWFPILFIVFMLPLPGYLVDALTGTLKQQVSGVTTYILYNVGYPIARNGVVISIGQYQLLVADACSGLNSMFSLTALGVLFMYLAARASLLHNALMIASILPIAFAANIVRVIALILITYHFGDEAGQGFLHRGAGIVLLLVALSALLLLDAVLGKVFRPRPSA
jgi:exosortase B